MPRTTGLFVVAALGLVAARADVATPAPDASLRLAGGATAAAIDTSRRLDVNRLDLWTSNTGWVGYDGRDVGPPVPPGEQIVYGLFDPCDPTAPVSTAVLEGPVEELTFRAVSPATGALGVGFNLPAAGPARIEVFAVNGRRMLARDFGTLDLGWHTTVLPESAAWPSGLYFLRLVHPSGEVFTRSVIIR